MRNSCETPVSSSVLIALTLAALLASPARADTIIINNYGIEAPRRPLNHCFIRACQYRCVIIRTWWQVSPCPMF